ncbi:MAG: transcription elongation factor GreA [Magnetococcales bacterium]|nr:transcription elongation factor GreA [Magnetococcales bacterium]MBF0604362.1 transcription elongation factor GreA [Magnetococcales bacterium]HAT49535.1 transcription elongation factor GreA [Alphaproteobacteria bacterium]
MSQRTPMTVLGAEKLREELKRLKSVERPRIVEAISVAREHGDLSENAEYHAAKEQQSFNEGRIKELETSLSSAEIIDPSRIQSSKVVFGATVTVADVETDEEATYQIVGVDEADLDQGMISITSPMARGMIGKEEGDQVQVHAPGGLRRFEIIEIHYR